MAEASDVRELFRQNLIDAGCGQEEEFHHERSTDFDPGVG